MSTDLERWASELLDQAYEVEDAIQREDNEEAGVAIDAIGEICQKMSAMLEVSQ